MLVLAYLTENYCGILKKREKPTAQSWSLLFTEGSEEDTEISSTTYSLQCPPVPPAHLPL